LGLALRGLERHGYRERDDHGGQAVAMNFDLGRVYKGTLDAPIGACLGPIPPSRPANHGQAVHEADRDGVNFSGIEVTTVLVALDTAEGYELGCAAECADCPDQADPTADREVGQ
jgi:hypothetical protein